MTDLTRLLEYLATADEGSLEITRFISGTWCVRLSDLDDEHAIGRADSLESAARCCVASALHKCMLEEPSPTTEPPPKGDV